MLSQPSDIADKTVPAQYSHFLQMWEFLEDASGLQDRDFIVVQAPGVDGRQRELRRQTDQTLNQTPALVMFQLQEGK